MRVNVVGAGIMGLCTAHALLDAGHRVTVFDQGPIPNPLGSSVDQHRLIRHPYGQMSAYAHMVSPALRAWEGLWSSLGKNLYRPTSTLMLAKNDLTWVESALADMETLGLESRILDAAGVKSLAPALNTADIELAAWVDSGGILLADQIIAALGTHLLLRGVTMRTNTPVVDIDPVRGSLVTGDGERLRSDVIVVAAGPWVHALRPDLRGKVRPSRQLVLYLQPPPATQQAWERTPMVLDIHGAGGIYVVPPTAGTGLKVGDHSFSLKGHPDDDRQASEAKVRTLFESCRSRIQDIDGYSIVDAKTCYYTVQPEERFVLERKDRMVTMSGFSGHGFKFGALMGRLAAATATGAAEPESVRALAAGEIADSDQILSLTSPFQG